MQYFHALCTFVVLYNKNRAFSNKKLEDQKFRNQEIIKTK